MADFTMTIPDADMPRVISALCAAGGHADVTNDNARLTVIKFITDVTAAADQRAATAAALAAVTVPPPVALT